MNDQYQNGFCPMCGALLRNGVCPCCQYGAEEKKPEEPAKPSDATNQDPYGDPYSYSGQDYGQNPYYNNTSNASQGVYGGYGANASQNMYNGQAPYSDAGGNPGKNSGKNYGALAILVAISMILITMAVVIPYYMYASKRFKDRKEEAATEQKDDWDSYFNDNSDAGDADKSPDASDDQNDDFDDTYKGYSQTLAGEIDWDDKTWKEEPKNCEPDELWDYDHRYYEEFRNCIHEDVDYKIVFEAEEQLDRNKNICMRVTYYQLEGNIPNLDEINRKLRDTACYYMDDYNDNEAEFEEFFKNYGEAYTVSATSYITYHDDSTLSMAVNNKYTSAFYSGIEVDCVNVDLETGMILDNTQIIDPTEDFVKTVVDHSTMQNGSSAFLDDTDTKTLQEMFKDEKRLILFYTPCGMEVGLNYTYSYSYGWITTTLTDYEQYLKSY